MLHSFATRAANRVERSRQWRARTRAEQVEFDDDREASLWGGEFGALRIALATTGRHRMRQSTVPIGLAPTLKFLFQEDGSSRVTQGGSTTELHAGQWCALRKDLPFTIDAPGHGRQLGITLPCALLPPPRRGIEWWRRPRSYAFGPAQILHASAQSMLRAGAELSAEDRARLGGQIAVLAEMTIRAGDPTERADPRSERRRAILAFIDENLGNPELGVASIVRTFGISSRSVHKLFEGEVYTVARMIWERRLERCRDDMLDPAMANCSITEIAHLWGFSDSQHFSRAFKARYGMTPRDYRSSGRSH